MKRYLCVLLGLLILSVSVPAYAKTLYFGIQAGVSTQPDSDNIDTSNPANNFELNTQQGYNASVVVGAKFGSLRGEIEGVVRQNDNNKFNQGGTVQGAEGELRTFNVFLNGYYELDIFDIVSPYIGGGIGYGTVALDLEQLDGTVVVNDNDTLISYQLILGVGINITENVTLTGDYRYFSNITDAELNFQGGLNHVENSDIQTHEVRVGVRFWIF
ncbi:MAG: outer membrane beta-barrel protein [candidate division Zixibacteria bacterium]|nr:porin family protein [candidate division KSB1 bacterium]NIS47237.1 porin family protein [candidate division Zixibacteria bacterium]NIT72686.1 porin family protein [candidate division KSB1 bacterium]NIV07445.1 outer membrane beta-barrel protein [candidate division Zixibacteria bacterium]NIW70857.1 outer membrane beta-barrel protein [candidate division KSB1 bacterium]